MPVRSHRDRNIIPPSPDALESEVDEVYAFLVLEKLLKIGICLRDGSKGIQLEWSISKHLNDASAELTFIGTHIK